MPAGRKTPESRDASVNGLRGVRAGAFEDFIPVARLGDFAERRFYLDAVEGCRVEKIPRGGADVKAAIPIVDLSNSTWQLNVIARAAEVTDLSIMAQQRLKP